MNTIRQKEILIARAVLSVCACANKCILIFHYYFPHQERWKFVFFYINEISALLHGCKPVISTLIHFMDHVMVLQSRLSLIKWISCLHNVKAARMLFYYYHLLYSIRYARSSPAIVIYCAAFACVNKTV